MTTITLQEAQANLADLIHRLSPGEEVVILEGDRPVATLSVATRGEPSVQGEWWAALQRVQASQTARGFAGIASNINRDDAQYDDRMRKIDQNTMSGDGSRSCGST